MVVSHRFSLLFCVGRILLLVNMWNKKIGLNEVFSVGGVTFFEISHSDLYTTADTLILQKPPKKTFIHRCLVAMTSKS